MKKKSRRAARKALLYAAVISMTVYIVWRLFFTLPTRYGPVTFIVGLLLILSELMAALEAFIEYIQMEKDVLPELPHIDLGWYPDVDVFIATHNEPVELLYKTVNACTFLHYPDKNKVHVYLCDDSDRPEMAKLAQDFGIGYFGLSDNKHAKAGNLNNALSKTHSPLVVTLDADMIPRSNFLMRTVPYFFLPRMKKDEDGRWVQRAEDEIDPNDKIGFIQTPQSFYNPDLFQFNLYSEQRIPNEQDFFFREVNVGRNAANAAIYAGSNTMLLRQALEEVGGLATDSITEDFSTGLRIQKAGYRTYAIDETLAQGLAPDSIKSLLSQRERWGRGCVQSLRNEKPFFARGVPLATKISYAATLSYWWAFFRRMIYVLSPIISVLFNLRIVEATTWQVLVFWLPSYLLYNRALRVLSGNIRNQHWSNVVDTIIFPYMVGPIMAETLGIKKRKFVVTEKKRNKKHHRASFLFALPHIILLVTSLWSLGIIINVSLSTGTLYNLIISYWIVINTKNLLFALFFMYGRPNHRMAERFYMKTPLTARYGGKHISTTTSDVSETGLAFLLERPEYLPVAEPVQVTVAYKEYTATMQTHVVHVVQMEEGWKYSVHIDEMDEENTRQYMQVVYDHTHSLPKTLDESISIFDDFNLNLARRVKRVQSSLRRLPRVPVNLSFATEDGITGTVTSFNYLYATLKTELRVAHDDILKIRFPAGTVLELTPIQLIEDTEDEWLYQVVNSAAFTENDAFAPVLDSWMRHAGAPDDSMRGHAVIVAAKDAVPPCLKQGEADVDTV